MPEQDSFLLVSRLWAATQSGRVSWGLTSAERVYTTELGDYEVRIAENDDPEYPESPDYAVMLYKHGNWIETISNSDLRAFGDRKTEGKNGYQLMKETHRAAHRQALGVDDVIADIIASLGDDHPSREH